MISRRTISQSVLSSAILPFVSLAATATGQSCADLTHKTFVDKNGEKRDCSWLADELMTSPDQAARDYCFPPEGYRLPLAAVVCPETCRRPCPTECRDTNALIGNPNATKKKKKCKWIRKKQKRLDRYCSSEAGYNSRGDSACPKTCGKCGYTAQITCPALSYSSHSEDDRLTLSRSGKPDRKFRIYTPPTYDKTTPSKIVFIFHGWTTGTYCQGKIFMRDDWLDIADEHNYVLVGVDGLADNDDDNPRSFTFPGSADGLGRDGTTTTTCNDNQSGPDYCYSSCGGCQNRCGWTHCRDDDIQFFVDLVDHVATDRVCVDRDRVFAYGYSMGGMFSWSLGQDPRSAPLLAGIGAVMGLPLHDHLVGKGVEESVKLPVIGIYGDRDCSVPPGDGSREYNEVCDDDGYYYVDAWHLHRKWALDHQCDANSAQPGSARFEYVVPGRNEIECSTHCDPSDWPPASVDCRVDDRHGKEPWHLDAVLKFFEDHST